MTVERCPTCKQPIKPAKEKAPPMRVCSERELIKELTEDLIRSEWAMWLEGGVYSDSIGKPVAEPDDLIGRACTYLGYPIPITPGWDVIVWKGFDG